LITAVLAVFNVFFRDGLDTSLKFSRCGIKLKFLDAFFASAEQ
jgi:hypothetical protein